MQKRLSRILAILAVIAVLQALVPAQFPATAATSELFFSEYTEGSSYNKALEIYNGTGSDVDLATYTLTLYSNGSLTEFHSLSLSGMLADGDVYVIALLAVADATSSSVINFNGNDAIVLMNGVSVVDAIGQMGVNPGDYWGSGEVTTKDHTLRRKPDVCSGDPVASDAFDPAPEWDSFPVNTFDGFGSHSANCDVVLDSAPLSNPHRLPMVQRMFRS